MNKVGLLIRFMNTDNRFPAILVKVMNILTKIRDFKKRKALNPGSARTLTVNTKL